jgi:hypothetical protein
MMTPVPIPLIRGRWLSSAEKGQRAEEAAFFSLEMLTTLGWARCTAATTGDLRALAASAGRGADQPAHAIPANSIATPRRPHVRRVSGSRTVLVPIWD